MKYLAEIIFGKDQVVKFHNNQPLNDFEKIINLKKYNFESREERNAFYKGIGEATGWLEFEIIKEFEETINEVKEKKINMIIGHLFINTTRNIINAIAFY